MTTYHQIDMKVETISFKTEYAIKYGVEAAILIQGIQFGLVLNRNKQSHFHNGKVWMYNSVREWHETYPFMSESTIKRALLKLKEEGLIEVLKLDSNPMNKTNWYTLTNALGQNEPIEKANLNQSKQYITNNIKQTIKEGYLDSFELWFKYKAEKKQAYKETGMKMLISQYQTKYSAEDFAKAVEHSIAQNYSGIFPAKVEAKQDLYTPKYKKATL